MLKDTLERLAAMPATDLPFITVYVDLTPALDGSYPLEVDRSDPPPLRSWRRAGASRRMHRPGIAQIEALLVERSAMLPARGPERDSFEADAERIVHYLEDGFDPSARGLALFACAGEGTWEVHELPVPTPTRLVIDRLPFISPLAYLDDAYERYAICLADSTSARVYVVSLGRASHSETIKGPRINYKMTGGLSQKRIQTRIANAVSEHMRDVARRLEQIVADEDIRWVVLGGDEIAYTELKRNLAPWVWERVVEVNRLPTTVPEHEAVARTLEAIEDAERAASLDNARRALGEALADGLGAAGVEAVTAALRQGAVETLILDPGLAEVGWRCLQDASQVGSGGTPAKCPVGPGAAEPVDLREELTAMALRAGADVEFVEGSEELARAGGIAALLRWKPGSLPNRIAAAA